MNDRGSNSSSWRASAVLSERAQAEAEPSSRDPTGEGCWTRCKYRSYLPPHGFILGVGHTLCLPQSTPTLGFGPLNSTLGRVKIAVASCSWPGQQALGALKAVLALKHMQCCPCWPSLLLRLPCSQHCSAHLH